MAEKKPLKREWFCGQIGAGEVGRTITVYGWVESKRELGGITFLDLRDRQGVLQIVVNEHFSRPDLVRHIGREFVLAVQGEVVRRSNPNPELPTGQVELLAQEIEILAEAEMPPFFPDSQAKVAEELRFKYRFIDLRNQRLQKNFRLRSDICRRVRNYLGDQGFVEIETPILSKATPEGARDYLVPSRIYRGKMFALPQSPQLFKQLLMISGFERYFQIARCFRDEDLRADRQPEFTQIDMEMSFAEAEELFTIVERLLVEIFSLQGIRVEVPFRKLSYCEAMEGYGSDKPDLRIPYRIQDFSESAARLGSSLLNGVLAGGGRICGIVIPEGAAYSRKMLDEANEVVKQQGGKGAIWLRQSEGLFRSSLKVADERIAAFYKENGLAQPTLVFLVADLPPRVFHLTGKLREHLGRSYLNSDRREFLWVTDFPLFFFNEEEKRLDSNHHPFTSPRSEDIPLLDSDPLLVKALAYDLVLNGIEIGGGSQRIHDANLQRKIMRLLNLPDEEIEEKFGYFLNALKFGAPPHLGIALGLDRIVMLCCGESSIRDVIAFPKTTSSLCLLTGSPSAVSAQQLAELGIALKE